MQARHLLLLLLLSAPALAQPPRWSQLNQDQQNILQRHEQDWASMPEHRRQRLAENAQRWANMSPEERQQARSRHRVIKDLAPEQRQALRKRWQSLDDTQRHSLRQRLADMSPEQRQQALDRFLQRQSGKGKGSKQGRGPDDRRESGRQNDGREQAPLDFSETNID